MNKKYITILLIILVIVIGGLVGYNTYEKNMEYDRVMIEADKAINMQDYEEVLNILAYAKSLKKETPEIKQLEDRAALELENNQKIEKAKTFANDNKEKEAIEILKSIENNDVAQKLLVDVENKYNEKLKEEEDKKQDEIFEENFSKLPSEELEKTRKTLNENLKYAALKYINETKLIAEDIDCIRTLVIADYQNGMFIEKVLQRSTTTTKISDILDKTWSDVGYMGDEVYSSVGRKEPIPISIHHDDTVRNTINSIMNNLYNGEKEELVDERNSFVFDSNYLFSLQINNDDQASENVQNLVKNIRKGVDELIDQEIKRLQEISNQSDLYLDYDRLKYELHPGTYNDIYIDFTKDRIEDNRAIVNISFSSMKSTSEPIRYKFYVNSSEIVEILKSVEVHKN